MRSLIALLLLFAEPAVGATITASLEEGDTPAFRFRVAKLSKAIVAFESEGGSLLAGIRIGEIIRMKGFATVVPTGARRASACAIAWLGGAQRVMGEPALIGIHAAYRDDGTGPTESGAANAILGAYLSAIGLSENAIFYVTMAAPNSMTWLTLMRWPQRNYALTPGTLTVQCDGGVTCTALGYADWETFNPITTAHARGTAQYQYSLVCRN